MGLCAACGLEAQFEYDGASGTMYCTLCGSVVEENGIVAEVTFGENNTGAAIVQGSYVGADQTRAKVSSGRRPAGAGGIESREQTITNGRRKIQAIINALKLPDRFVDTAQRFYTLALNSNFVRGRRTNYVVAACLYIVCRMDKTSHMLIDFSDLLQVNVFVLGSTYLKLVKTLSLTIPAIDPSLYISRFASLLEFGDETQQVANDAVRLVQRFSRDWMSSGRRPAGICGACLVLAARMNNFRRSVEEVVQVVKIAEATLKKRLDEFAETPSSTLSVNDFRSVWLSDGMDPPAFTQEKRKQEAAKRTQERKKRREAMRVRFSSNGIVSDDDDDEEDEEEEEEDQEDGEDVGGVGPRKKKRRRLSALAQIEEEEDEGNVDEEDGDPDQSLVSSSTGAGFKALAAEMGAMQDAGGSGLAAEEEAEDEEAGAPDDETGENVDVSMDEEEEEEMLDALAATTAQEEGREVPSGLLPHARGRSASPSYHLRKQGLIGRRDLPEDTRTAEEIAAEAEHDASVRGEIQAELSAPPYTALEGELASKEHKAFMVASTLEGRSGNPVWTGNDPLDDLDEDELDGFILSAEDVRIKERLWMEFNKEYLKDVAARHLQAELDEKPLKRRERKKKVEPRDSSAPRGATAAESTKQLLKQKKFSKKINYAAFDSLLADDDGVEEGGEGGGIKKHNSLFDEDEGDRYSARASSRASSVAPSEVSASSVGTNASRKSSKVKRKRSRSSDDAGVAAKAERLREKLAAPPPRKLGGGIKFTPSKKGGSGMGVGGKVMLAGRRGAVGVKQQQQQSQSQPRVSESPSKEPHQVGADEAVQEEGEAEGDYIEPVPVTNDEPEDDMMLEFRRMRGASEQDEDAEEW